ncbi:MAG TPA: hypothetical protein DDW65_02935 [Firmicutes bacterium]|nr:hypothetical protein [Bacillota bacterium]
MAPLLVIRNITIFIGVGIIFITLFFFFILAKKLTTPLRELKRTMEDITISNLPEPMPIKHENNEIEALNQAFRQMRDRLNQAIEREFKSQSLQMKAHFDALQAQINPHFLYNMLTILGNMGDEAGQNEISLICLNLSKILRYSTSTGKAWASLQEEINHTSNYLSLMKRRFEHRLDYQIDIDEAIMDFPIPKLTIQPLVENSITHGFENSPDPMKIIIKGGFIENGWQISIMDNGSGFAGDILENLKEKIHYYSTNLISDQKDIELSIGGMGLISTFARLFLLYGNELRFELKNMENGGACINIGGSLDKIGKEGILNV